MEKTLMKVVGYTGELELLEDKLKIKRKVGGFLIKLLAGGLPREKVILLKDISTINFSSAKKWRKAHGFIQFVVKGAPTPGSYKFSDIEKDENAICFNWQEAADFEKMKEMIETKIASIKIAFIQEGGAKPSNLDELEKLAALRDKGIVTEEEFEVKKKQLLDS